MIIKRLKLTNFMNVENAELHFQDGINVLTGPTGAGKSTILEAITYCLIDRKRGDRWEEYIQSGKTFFEIELDIDLNGIVSFKYRGEIKYNIPHTYKTIKYNGKEYNNSECKDFLDTIIDADMIQNVIFTMQRSEPVSSMRPMDRRDIFKKIFSSNFSTEADRVRKDLENNVNAQKELVAKIDTLQSQKYPFSRLEELDPSVLEKAVEEKNYWLDQKEVSRKDIELNTEIARHTEDLGYYISQRKTKEKDLEHLKENVAYKEITSRFLSEKASIEACTKKIEDTEVSIKELDKKKTEAEESLWVLTVSLEEKTKALLSAESDANEAKVNAMQATRHLEVHKKGLCIECGQSCPSDNIPVLEERVRGLSESYQAICDIVSKLKEAVSVMQTTKTAIERGQQETSKQIFTLKASINTYRLQIRHSEQLIDKYNQDEKTFNTLQEKIQKEIEGYEKAEAEEKEWIATHIITSSEALTVPYDDYIATAEKKIQEYNQAKAINEEREKQNEKLFKQKEETEKKIQDFSTLLNEKRLMEKDLNEAKTIFEVALPNHINSRACDLLEKYMNSFLSRTKDSFEVKLDTTKKGVEFLYRPKPTDEFMNAKMASGFETAILTLAFKSATACAYNSNLLVLDEPDKDANDDSSMLFFETLLSLNGGFKQTIIISHRNAAVQLLRDNGAKVFRVEQGKFSLY